MSDWWRGAVVYQIYPRSFADSNGDGVGDLQGAAAKLDHVAKLGADAVWISPFYPSPMKDFGYDVSDYRDVDPAFGTLADFDAFVARAHALGLKVVIDQVWSHTSDAHPWFAESRQSAGNEKSDWYVWADAKPDGGPPNNWQAMFGGPSWTWDARRRQYYFHNFLPEQPDLDLNNRAVWTALLDVAGFWLARGVDGFRFDVVNFLACDPALADNPPVVREKTPARPHRMQAHVHDRNQPVTLEFLQQARALLDRHAAFSVGEIEDEDPLPIQRRYTERGAALHTAYSFALLRNRAVTPALIHAAMTAWEGSDGWPAWSFSNHDVVRAATRLAGDDPARAALMNALLLCLRGTAFLYQGEELGLPHADVAFARLRDPEAIAFWPHGVGRDGARTPMPWKKAAPMAGFTSEPDAWLPLDARHAALAVDAQAGDPASPLEITRAWIALRRSSPALRLGDWTPAEAPDPVLAFLRAHADETLLCAFNLGDEPRRLEDARLASAKALAVVNGASLGDLPPWSAFVAKL